jgi:hypothetical protein
VAEDEHKRTPPYALGRKILTRLRRWKRQDRPIVPRVCPRAPHQDGEHGVAQDRIDIPGPASPADRPHFPPASRRRQDRFAVASARSHCLACTRQCSRSWRVVELPTRSRSAGHAVGAPRRFRLLAANRPQRTPVIVKRRAPIPRELSADHGTPIQCASVLTERRKSDDSCPSACSPNRTTPFFQG